MMENIYAVVVAGIVTNLVVWDGVSPWAPAEGEAILVPEGVHVEIGYSYADGVFSAPAEQGE